MKQLIFFVLALLGAMDASSQRQEADSLANVIETQPLSNTERLEAYRKIVDVYVLGDPEKAADYAEKGAKLAEKEGDWAMASKFNASLGQIYNTLADYETAIAHWQKALDHAQKAQKPDLEAAVYTGIGILHARQAENAPALDYFLRALALYEKAGNSKACLRIMTNIATIYRTIDDNERALYYLEKAENLAETLHDENGKMTIYYELTAFYHYKKNIDLALEYGKKTYEISRSLGNKVYQGAAADGLSILFCDHLKDYETAWKYAAESLQIAQEMGDPTTIAGGLSTISNIYREQKRYKKCIAAAEEAMAIDSLNLNNHINLMENIVLSHIQLGDKEAASEAFHKYIRIVDKRIDQGNRETLADMEIKYETEKKELQIASLEKARQLYIWLSIAGILLALALIAALWQTKKNAGKEKLLIATRSVLDGEMRERTRLAQDLHDRLSGNLSAVKIELGGQADALQHVRDKLDKCILEIREAAHDMMPSSLQFGMKVALEDFAAQFPIVKFHFFGEERRMDARLEYVVYCCANELVNNSIKHAGATVVNLQLVQNEKYVALTVSDDGCGFDEKTASNGMGLTSIRNRVASCNGKMDVVTAPGKGTEITIELLVN
jgi:signal transduction histidine kinase